MSNVNELDEIKCGRSDVPIERLLHMEQPTPQEIFTFKETSSTVTRIGYGARQHLYETCRPVQLNSLRRPSPTWRNSGK